MENQSQREPKRSLGQTKAIISIVLSPSWISGLLLAPAPMRLLVDSAAVYASFITWAILQERLGTREYAHIDEDKPAARFESATLLIAFQGAFSACVALSYILIRARHQNRSTTSVALSPTFTQAEQMQPWPVLLGLSKPVSSSSPKGLSPVTRKSNGYHHHATSVTTTSPTDYTVIWRIFRISIFNSLAGPLAFVSLRHVSYPTLVLAKSCKLVPVMLTNVLLYRRKFSRHKYFVVALVTLGIIIFTRPHAPSAKHQASSSSSSSSPSSSSGTIGSILLMLSLFMDGLVNSTQDEVFTRFGIDGAQMMFWMNTCSFAFLSTSLLLPLPSLSDILSRLLFPSTIDTISSSSSASSSIELISALSFVTNHPSVIPDILASVACNSVGQLFIFDVLQHFDSLTLVTLTLTRKLLTMLLSVIIFRHPLHMDQWFGVALVFAALSIESYVKMSSSKQKKPSVPAAKSPKDLSFAIHPRQKTT